SSKLAQHRAAGCVYQVIVAEVRCNRVERSERSAGTLDLGDGPVECNHGCGHDREQVIVESDDLGVGAENHVMRADLASHRWTRSRQFRASAAPMTLARALSRRDPTLRLPGSAAPARLDCTSRTLR